MEMHAESQYRMGLLPSIMLPRSCSNLSTQALLHLLHQLFLLGTDFNIVSTLFSFPKGNAGGPSGLRVEHLIDAAHVSPPISIGTSLRDIVDLLAAGKEISVARFWLGDASPHRIS